MYCTLAENPRFEAPFGALICGPTMSGKSHFVATLIEKRHEMIDKPIDRVVYCYGQWQKMFENLRPHVEFYEGLNEVFGSDHFFDPAVPTLLILDDLAQELAGNPRASKLFTQGIHHKNVSVVLIMQNLYTQGRAMRDIQLNAQYMVLFKMTRDINQIEMLGRQTGLPHLTEAFEKVTSEPYQPLVLDLRPNTPSYLRVRSHVTPGYWMRIYLKPFTTPPCRKT